MRLMIAGALANPEIMKALAQLDFDKKEIMWGKNLLAKMENQQYERENEGNAQKETTQHLYAAYAEAHAKPLCRPGVSALKAVFKAGFSSNLF